MFEAKWKKEMLRKGEICERRVSKNARELEDKVKKMEMENRELRERWSKKIAPETVKDMEEEMGKLRDQMEKLIQGKGELEKGG